VRLVSYRYQGETSFGFVQGQGVVDLRRHGFAEIPSLKAFLAVGALGRVDGSCPADLLLEQVELLPPIPDPDKVLCVGVNYHDHREETGRAESAFPTLFTRFANTQVGHQQSLIRPRVSKELDFEGELAVVVGRRARHVSKANALSYVAGYACYQDGSVRDFQRHTSQFTAGKNFVGTGGFGPWLVTADEIPDPSKLTLSFRLNGEQLQHTTTDLMIFNVPALLEYITAFTELVPGDVIATGTPAGVGWKRSPQIFLKPGDVADVEISGVGTLRNLVVDEDGAAASSSDAAA
jgi:2-keto-4-pentenoate hydratase/2-oxohepta-3-ene-1,7-dioic acid hydratase in catechol pathway